MPLRTSLTYGQMDRSPPPTAAELRLRLSAWTRYVYVKNKYASVASMARDLPHNQGSLNDIINGKGTIGLEFAVKLALAGRESLDTLCTRDPEAAWFRSGPPSTSQTPGRAAGEDQVAVHERAIPYAPTSTPREAAPPGGPPAPPKPASPSAARPGSRKTGAGRH